MDNNKNTVYVKTNNGEYLYPKWGWNLSWAVVWVSGFIVGMCSHIMFSILW